MSKWREEILGDGQARLLLGDCREIIPTLGNVGAVVTDPVWPNVPAGLIAGSDRPFELFAEFCALIPESAKRLAIEMRNDSVFGSPIISQEGRRVIPSVSPKAQPGDRPPNGHPCSRALVHQEFVVNWCSDEGETILDPFCGSGTTGVAAVKLGRKFIGIELHEPYFDIACRRISDALKQPDLFIDAPKEKPVQEALGL